MNCDRIAPFYVIGERLTFGRALDRCRTRLLPALGRHRTALVCGDGDGRFLVALVQSGTASSVDSVDISRRMTALAKRRVHDRQQAEGVEVGLFCGDIRTFASSRTYDLIATHFLLDCFAENEIRGVVHQIASHADDRATWLVSEFQIPEHGIARLVGSVAVGALYAAFRLLTGLRARRLPDYQSPLAECGFVREIDIPSWGGLLTSQIWRRTSRPVNPGSIFVGPQHPSRS